MIQDNRFVFILGRFFDTCPAVSLSDYFRSKPASAPRELTVEEIRADRRRELLCKLDHLNAEAEAVSASLLDFLFRHRTPRGDLFAANLEEIAPLREREFQLRKRECEILAERSSILEQLSKLVENKTESVHVAGRLVTHA